MHIKLVLSQLNDWKFESAFCNYIKKQKPFMKVIGNMERITEAANVMVSSVVGAVTHNLIRCLTRVSS